MRKDHERWWWSGREGKFKYPRYLQFSIIFVMTITPHHRHPGDGARRPHRQPQHNTVKNNKIVRSTKQATHRPSKETFALSLQHHDRDHHSAYDIKNVSSRSSSPLVVTVSPCSFSRDIPIDRPSSSASVSATYHLVP